MRKAPDIWRRWNIGSGNGLHSLQLRIALRACELLRVGGRLVYSTCTFNPIEDEAVVAEVGGAEGGAGRARWWARRWTGCLQSCQTSPTCHPHLHQSAAGRRGRTAQQPACQCPTSRLLTPAAPLPRLPPQQVLRRTKGAFELVDVSDSLPGLRRLPGMQRWKVRDRDRWYSTWEEGKEVRR